MAGPACSIDTFARPFSLPFGVDPALPAADRVTYFAELGAQAEFLYLDRPGRVENDPGLPRARRVRALPFNSDASRSAVLPRTTENFGSPLEPDQAVIDAVAIRAPPAAVNPEVAASRFRWDDHARAVSVLPIPTFTDESLVVDWGPAPATTAPLGQAIPGILADPTSQFLLATAPAARDGELDRTLLRTPVIGLVRFERYRHLVLEGGSLSVSHPSNAGAVVIRALGGKAVSPASGAPILRSNLVVFENVTAASAAKCLASLVFCILLRRTQIKNVAFFKDAFQKSVTVLLKTWIAYLKIARPAHRPNQQDPLPDIPQAMRTPFEGAGTPTPAQIEQLVNRALTNPTVNASLVDYIQSVFAPLIAGLSWKEIEIDLPATPVTPNKRAFRELEALMTSRDTWLPCFAGCPIGKPGRTYEFGAAAVSTALRPLEELTTFDLEALILAGEDTDAFPTITAASEPDRFNPLNLTPFDSVPGRPLVAFRVVDASMPTPDWPRMLVKGTNAAGPFHPPFDFSAVAADGHPLAEAVQWNTFLAASDARTRLDDLLAAKVTARNVGVAKANLDWWIAKTNVSVAGNWPAFLAGAGPAMTPPTPANPYGVGMTVTARTAPGANLNLPSGFDEFDLEAALEAQTIVKNGRTHAPDLDLALLLAVLDREGFKSLGGFERTGPPRSFPFPGGFAALSAKDLTDIAVLNWLVFPFGLDLLVRGSVTNSNGHPFFVDPINAGTASRFRTTFGTMAQRLVTADILPASWEPMLGPERMLAALERRKLGRHVGATLQFTALTRSALVLGVVLQQATFQWVHNRLSLATRSRGTPPPPPALEDFEWVKVDELVTGQPPTPGPDALAAQRRKYIAYWALVYLAFNTSPRPWNAWVNAVPGSAIAAGTTVSEYLVFHTNANPATVEPAAPGGPPRVLAQRGNMLRFAAGLDAYLRLNIGGAAVDKSDPAQRAAPDWPVT